MKPQEMNFYVKELFKIAGPIIMGNLGFILLGVGDVIVAGRHSTQTFAAISIAAAIVNCVMTLGMGLTSAISPLLSNYRGQNIPIKRYFYPSIRFALFWALVSGLLILAIIPTIPLIGFEKPLVEIIQQYMFISALSTFGGGLHQSLKEFLQAFEIVMFPNLLTIFCVFLNLGLNIIFVFGWGIIPSMGAIGLALATFFVRYFMGFALLIYCLCIMQLHNYHEKGYYKNLTKIGLPISMAILTEFVAFNSIAIIMGRISGIYAAAQNLLCTFINTTFMVPFAISNAIAVKVGFANGANNMRDLKRYSCIGTGMSLTFMVFGALTFILFPKFIVSIFTSDVQLYNIVFPVVVILSVYQIFDGMQISLSGICKGIKQTKIVLISNFIAYWCISIPLGCYLGLAQNMKLCGFWIGLLSASATLCVIMLLQLKMYFAKRRKLQEI